MNIVIDPDIWKSAGKPSPDSRNCLNFLKEFESSKHKVYLSTEIFIETLAGLKELKRTDHFHSESYYGWKWIELMMTTYRIDHVDTRLYPEVSECVREHCSDLRKKQIILDHLYMLTAAYVGDSTIISKRWEDIGSIFASEIGQADLFADVMWWDIGIIDRWVIFWIKTDTSPVAELTLPECTEIYKFLVDKLNQQPQQPQT